MSMQRYWTYKIIILENNNEDDDKNKHFYVKSTHFKTIWQMFEIIQADLVQQRIE